MPAGLEPALSDRKSDVLAARRRHHIVSGGAYRIRTGNLCTAGGYVTITPMLQMRRRYCQITYKRSTIKLQRHMETLEGIEPPPLPGKELK